MRSYYIYVYFCPKKKKFNYRAGYDLGLIMQFIKDCNITRYEIIDKDDTILISHNMGIGY